MCGGIRLARRVVIRCRLFSLNWFDAAPIEDGWRWEGQVELEVEVEICMCDFVRLVSLFDLRKISSCMCEIHSDRFL